MSRYQLVDGPEEYQIAALTLAVVMLALDHEKVLAKRGCGQQDVPVEARHICDNTEPVVDSGQGGCGIEEWSECLQDREEMG